MCAQGSVRGVSAVALTATLLVLVVGGAADVGCPPKCLCFHTAVRCMYLGLKRIPRVPPETTILDLRYNKIRTIPPNHLKHLKRLQTLLLNNNHITKLQNGSFTGLESLQYLYLYKNRIRVIEKQVFQGLDKLEQLYLHFNDLATFEADTFSNLTSLERLFLHNNRLQRVPKGAFSNLHSLRRLRLDSNALVCDCELMWLAQMVKEKQHTTQVAATCQFPTGLQGKSLNSLNDSVFQCRDKRGEGGRKRTRDTDGYIDLNVDEPRPGTSGSVQDDSHASRNGGATSVKVSTKPRFLLLPIDVNVTEGSPVEIECQASGDPRPDIVWTRNDEPIVEGPRIQISSRGAFSISSAERNDSATYRCTAANHLGRISSSATLTVLIPPKLIVEPDDKYASPGTSIQFTCQADGVPPPIISWFKDGQPIVPFGGLTISLHGISLGVQHVKPSDEGEYICRAQNAAGMQEASATLYVRDKVAPVIRKEPRDLSSVSGQDVMIMPCKADGRPKPVINWRKDGYILETDNKHRIEGDGSLIVYNVTQDDAGIYECSAQNHVGYATAQARVTVQDDPTPHIGDQFLHQSFEEARQQVNRAVNDTISQLFQRDRSRSPHPHELLRIFRFPSEDGREIARATEMIERTLKIVMRHVESGMVFNLTSFSYQDLLSPEKLLLLRNLSGCLAHRRTVYCDDMCFHSKYRTIDGTCNNLRNPLWGASLTGFRRVLNPVYENGFNTPVGWSKTKQYHGFFKPSARLVSSRIISTEEVTPDHHCTHMLMQWGQFLDHDIDHALPSISSESFDDGMNCQRSCDYASPCFPIEIPTDDPRIHHHRCMEFTRSSGICGSGMTSVFFNTVLPREQINQLTSYIDASQVYGSSAVEMRLLRNLTHNRGSLRVGILMSTGKPLMPFSEGAPVDCRRGLGESGIDCFLAGDIRANEQSGLTAMHTLWFREHNRIAEALRQLNPHWDGDTVFYEARKIVGAEIQHITYTHWLHHIIGPQGMKQLGEYSTYNTKIEPTISNVFATAAFRFGHSLINPILHRLNATFQPISEGHLPLHKAFFSPWRIVQEGGIDPLLRGLFATPAKLKMPGQFLNTELTEKLFRAAHEVALDLASLNIQRGRDHALPGYTDWRKACNLSVPENFDELSSHISSLQIRNKLQQLYGHPGNVDVWVGGLLEDPIEGARVGPTFLCLLVDQFKRLRDGDRFWYENPSMFKSEQLTQIKQVTLGRVMCDNGDDIRDVTPDVFVLPREQKPAFVQCSDIPYVDLRLWTECCKDCRNAGNFNSLTQTPGIRFRRQVEFSHVEDREHILMGITKGKQTKKGGDATLSFSSNDSENITHFEHEERINVPKPVHSHREVGNRGWVPRNGKKEVNNDDDLGSYVQDMTEQRIEGIEELIERLSKTVFKLNKKVSILELTCGGSIRKRRRKLCHDEDGHERHHGETWQKNPCTICKCRRGKVQCRVTECSK